MSEAAGRRWAARLGPIGVFSREPLSMRLSDAQAYVAALERLGATAIWSPEGGRDVFAHSAMLLSATERLVVASGISSIWSRDAVAMLNGQRTLQEFFPDRFLLGLGVSHEPLVRMRGHVYEKPLQRMREYLDAMDRPATGALPPSKDSRVLAALGPRMLELSAARSAGAHPYFVTVEHTAGARKVMGPDALLAVEQAVILSTNPVAARRIARTHMKIYLGLENYVKNLRECGWSDADLAPPGSDTLVDAVVAWGGAGAIRGRAEAHLAAGADHVCVQVLRDESDPPLLDIWRELLPALKEVRR